MMTSGADPGIFSTGARKNQGHSRIELELYKEYIAEFRAKRAYNFEARNVKNCMKL